MSEQVLENSVWHRMNHKQKMLVLQIMQRLHNKATMLQNKHTGEDVMAINIRDLDHEYWKLTGGDSVMTSAGNEELLDKWYEEYRVQVVTKGNANYPQFGGTTFGQFTNKKLGAIITASNQQLLRELEGQAVYITTHQSANWGEGEGIRAIPLSIIKDKLKGYGEGV